MIVLVICGLAVARLTRLWRDDAIFENEREWVMGRLDHAMTEQSRWETVAAFLYDLLECPWCVSGWLSIMTVALVDSATSRSVPLPFLSWLAVWWIANLGYWLLELVADRDALAWKDREDRGLTP